MTTPGQLRLLPLAPTRRQLWPLTVPEETWLPSSVRQETLLVHPRPAILGHLHRPAEAAASILRGLASRLSTDPPGKSSDDDGRTCPGCQGRRSRWCDPRGRQTPEWNPGTGEQSPLLGSECWAPGPFGDTDVTRRTGDSLNVSSISPESPFATVSQPPWTPGPGWPRKT